MPDGRKKENGIITMDRAINNLKRPSKFDRCLSNINQEIEFLMEFEVDKDPAIPENVIDSLAALHKALEGYLK